MTTRARPSTETGSALAWCRQRLLVPGHPLSVTLPYAEPGQRDRILALSALVSEIAAVPGEVSSPEVARRKLDWWRDALVGREAHPAIRAWIASGADADLPAARLTALIDAVAREIEPPRFEQTAEFGRHAQAVAGPAALLEAALVDGGHRIDGRGEPGERFQAMAGAAYRLRVARDVVLDARRDRWLVPLELQAEYRITRQEVAAGEGGYRLDALVRHLAADAVTELDHNATAVEALSAWRHRHLLLKFHLDRALGRSLLRRPARVARERVPSVGPFAAMSIWRRARQLRRAAHHPRS